MEDGIQQYHFPKTSSSLTSHLSGLITLQLLLWFPQPPPHLFFSFLVLFLLFKVIWNFSTLEKQPALFYLLKAEVLLVAVVTLPTNSKNHALSGEKEIKEQVYCFLHKKPIQENIISFSVLKCKFWV